MPPHYQRWRTRGAPPLTSQRDLYSRLMAQGMSNAAACRIVGVNRKTGHRWRYGRSITNRVGEILTYPSITRPARAVSARFLSEAERITIADGLIHGRSIRALAGELGRAPSTVSREIRRNRDAATEAYHPFRAQRRAAGRRVRPKVRKLACNAELRAFVQAHLEQRWSPEQISTALPGRFPDRSEMRVVHETIYQALYAQGRGRLGRELVGVLRSGRVHRKRRRRSGERRGRFIAPMVMIDQRPAEVADRLVAGHWEDDLIMGTSNRSAIGTLVERTTRYLVLLHLPNGHGTAQVRDALVDALSAVPADVRRSLPGTMASRWAATTSSPGPRTSRSTSAIARAPGSAARTRTRMACCGSTSPRARISGSTRRTAWPSSLPLSMRGRARPSAGRPRPGVSIDSSCQPHRPACCDDRQNPPTSTWPRLLGL